MTIDLSVDHKPTNSGTNGAFAVLDLTHWIGYNITDESTRLCGIDEYIRIVSAGGSVESGRINCGIGLSRALGDFGLKSNSLIELEEQILIGK
jgi:hypothetical protein